MHAAIRLTVRLLHASRTGPLTVTKGGNDVALRPRSPRHLRIGRGTGATGGGLRAVICTGIIVEPRSQSDARLSANCAGNGIYFLELLP
jgi:hypothetical protein